MSARDPAPAGTDHGDLARLRRARFAVSVLFVANGVVGAAWLPRLSQVQAGLGLTDGGLGAALAVGAAGGLAVGPLAGTLAARMGTGRLAVVAMCSYAPLTFLPGVVTAGWMLALALFWFGAGDAVMDAAMNTHGLRVQTGYGRSIINAFHGYWSIGTVAGATIGAVSLALDVPLAPFLAGVAAVATLGVLLSARWLLPAPDPHHEAADALVLAQAGDVDPSNVVVGAPPRFAVLRRVLPLAAFILLAVVVEDVPSRWSSIYMTDAGATAATVGLAYVALTVTMTIGRFTGDRLVDAVGEVTVVRVSMAVVAVAMTAGLLVGTPAAYVAACAVTGLGVATVFPAAMHAAGHLPGIAPAMGVAMVGWLARAGFVAAPLVVGSISDRVGIAWGIATVVLAAAALVPLSRVLRADT